MDADAAVRRTRPPKTRIDKLLSRPESGVVIAAVAVYVVFAFLLPHFFSERVTSNILLSSATLGIIAVGVAMLMIAAQFDLSVGSFYELSSAIVILSVNQGAPGWLALPIVLAFGFAIGIVNGWLVTRLEIHSLIITLGSLMFYHGVLLAMTEVFSIRLKQPDPFLSSLDFQVGRIPGPFFWFLGLVGVFSFILTSTRFGNWLYATGGRARGRVRHGRSGGTRSGSLLRRCGDAGLARPMFRARAFPASTRCAARGWNSKWFWRSSSAAPR